MLLETILVGGAIGGAAWVANKIYFAPKKERERRRASAAEAERLFQEDILPTFCIIDSNIWMNEGYEAFFAALQAVLKQAQKTLFLYGPQFDEMCNIKKRTEYGKDRNRRARYAINRIEALQKDRLLTIKPIDVDAKAGAYADPLIIKLLRANTRQGNRVVFLSDDKELRIRARQLLADAEEEGGASYKIIEGERLSRQCVDYCYEKGIAWIPPEYRHLLNEVEQGEAAF